jgi:hypothetical protein
MGLTDLFDGLAEVAKMKIIAYEDANFETLSNKEFTVMYNPNTFSQSYRSVWNSETPEGGTAESQNYRRLESDSVSFEFLFDGTGVSSTGESAILTIGASTDTDGEYVQKQIEDFLDITQKINPSTHQPNFLQLSWGTFVFNGVMESAEITYKLFHSSGSPLRATINATFKESVSQAAQAAEARKQSPDLTHFRLVEEGETLPLIAKKVYGDPAMYLELARINNINNFRKLKVGQQLVLPPIDKKENG